MDVSDWWYFSDPPPVAEAGGLPEHAAVIVPERPDPGVPNHESMTSPTDADASISPNGVSVPRIPKGSEAFAAFRLRCREP